VSLHLGRTLGAVTPYQDNLVQELTVVWQHKTRVTWP